MGIRDGRRARGEGKRRPVAKAFGQRAAVTRCLDGASGTPGTRVRDSCGDFPARAPGGYPGCWIESGARLVPIAAMASDAARRCVAPLRHPCVNLTAPEG